MAAGTVGYPVLERNAPLLTPDRVESANVMGFSVSVRYDNGGLYTFKPLSAEQRVRRDLRRMRAVAESKISDWPKTTRVLVLDHRHSPPRPLVNGGPWRLE